MDHIPDNTSTKTFRYSVADAKHLKATYGLTCYQAKTCIILRFVRMDSYHPTGIQWCLPIEVAHQGATIQVLNDGTLELIGSSDGEIHTYPRPQCDPPRASNDPE